MEDKEMLISDIFAFSFHYDFLLPLCEALNNDRVPIKVNDDYHEGTIELDDKYFKIKILLPLSLEKEATDKCKESIKGLTQGYIYSQSKCSDLCIRYTSTKEGELIIVIYANQLGLISSYLSHVDSACNVPRDFILKFVSKVNDHLEKDCPDPEKIDFVFKLDKSYL